jgi:hypothetical protein
MIISHVMYDVMSCGHPTTRLYRRVGTCTYKIVHNATFYIEGLSSLMTTQVGYSTVGYTCTVECQCTLEKNGFRRQ